MQSRPEIIGSDGGGIEALSRGPDVVSYALLIGRVRRASRPADRRVGFRISRSRSLLLADRHLHDLIALWQLPTNLRSGGSPSRVRLPLGCSVMPRHGFFSFLNTRQPP